MKFIFDENLSPKLAEGLKAFGEDVEYLTDHFPPGTADEVWLQRLGEEGWFLITRDNKIRSKPLEMEALKKNRVGAFFLSGKKMNRCQLIRQVVRVWHRIKDKAHKTKVPFTYQINRHGTGIDRLQLD